VLSLMSLLVQLMVFLLLLPNKSFPLPLMPNPVGKLIPVVSYPVVEPLLITVSPLLDKIQVMAQDLISLLKTLGVPLGEKTDILD